MKLTRGTAKDRAVQRVDLAAGDSQLGFLGCEVQAGIDERRQGDRTNDRNAILQVGHQIGVAAGEDDLRNRDGDVVRACRGFAGFSGTVVPSGFCSGMVIDVGKNETGEMARISKPRMIGVAAHVEAVEPAARRGRRSR